MTWMYQKLWYTSDTWSFQFIILEPGGYSQDMSGHEINFFFKEPSGSLIFQSGRQVQKVRSHFKKNKQKKDSWQNALYNNVKLKGFPSF